MSAFTDGMIDEGFCNPMDYMDYLENRGLDRLQEELSRSKYEDKYWEEYYESDEYIYDDDDLNLPTDEEYLPDNNEDAGNDDDSDFDFW